MAVASRADPRRAPLDDRRGAAAAAGRRLRAGAAEPRLRRLPAPARRRHRRLGRRLAGHDRPRQPRGAVARPRPARGGHALARARARAAAARLSRATSPATWVDPARAAGGAARRRTRSGSPARTAGTPARPAPSRSSSRATRCRWTRPPSWGRRSSSRLFRARGDERQRVFAAADRLRREVCGDEVSYVVTRNIQYTNVCYFRCGFCAFSKGKLAANLRGAPYLVPHEEIVRRAREAWDRGATEVCLQGGIHPAFTGDYYASRRRRDQGRGARPARPRVLGARGLAGRGDARPAARGLPRAAARPRASARCRARRRRSSTTRCARSSARTRSRPTSGSRCTRPPTASACART